MLYCNTSEMIEDLTPRNGAPKKVRTRKYVHSFLPGCAFLSFRNAMPCILCNLAEYGEICDLCTVTFPYKDHLIL